MLILIEKPKFTGNWNVNLQCKSTIEGVLFLKKKFSFLNYFIKVRSDFTISNIFLLTSRFHELNTPVSFLGWKNCYGSITVLDFVLGGNAETLKLFFKLEDNNDIGFPYPEVFLEKRYLENISEMETFSSRNRKQYFINLDNISIIWLKKKKELKYPDEYAFFLFDKKNDLF